jgi:hypothetical protein
MQLLKVKSLMAALRPRLSKGCGMFTSRSERRVDPSQIFQGRAESSEGVARSQVKFLPEDLVLVMHVGVFCFDGYRRNGPYLCAEDPDDEIHIAVFD